MARPLRPLYVELLIGFGAAFVMILVAGLCERTLIGDTHSGGHGGGGYGAFLLLVLGLILYAGVFLTLPFTRFLRLAGALDALLWGASFTAGGATAGLLWSALAGSAPRLDEWSRFAESFLLPVLMVGTLQAVLAVGLLWVAVRARPSLSCAPRPPILGSVHVRVLLQALGACLLGLGFFLGFLLATDKIGSLRDANPYLMSALPFAFALAFACLFLRCSLRTRRLAVVFGVTYGTALGVLHGLWYAVEAGIDRGEDVFVVVVAFVASVVLSGLLSFGVHLVCAQRVGRTAQPAETRG